MTRLLGVLAVSMAALIATPAMAWWDLGHMTIAAYAYTRLEPPVRDRVDHLLTLNPAYPRWTTGVSDADKGLAAFTHAATWADDIKRDPNYKTDAVSDPTASQNTGYSDNLVHGYWHYIDIPFSIDGTPVRAPDNPNALTQLRLFIQTLGSTQPDELKSYDLTWILHIVGDLHQPLHATGRFSNALDDDRGGNDEQVTTVAGKTEKLHLYWDALLGDEATPAKAVAAAKALPAPDAAKAKISDPALWLIESFTLAQNDVYGATIGQGAGPYQLTADYENRAAAVAKSQAGLAGARLAELINASLHQGRTTP